MSTVALRLQAAHDMSRAARRLSLQVSSLAASDPVLASGLIVPFETSYIELPTSWVFDEVDPRRLDDPHVTVGFWAEVMPWHEMSLYERMSLDPTAPVWSAEGAAERLLPVVRSLARCHDEYRLVHRDVDAYNLLCHDGQGPLVLTDWGAAVESRDPGHTVSATARGKRGIQPPELRDTRSGAAQWYNDAWNVGFVMCQLFLGRDQHPRVQSADNTVLPDLGGVPKGLRSAVSQLLLDSPAAERLPLRDLDVELTRWLEQRRTEAHEEEQRAQRKAQRIEVRSQRVTQRRTRRGERVAAMVTRVRRRTARHRRAIVGVTSGTAITATAAVVGVYLVSSAGPDMSRFLVYPANYETAVGRMVLDQAAERFAVGPANERWTRGFAEGTLKSIVYDDELRRWSATISVESRANPSWPTEVQPLVCVDPFRQRLVGAAATLAIPGAERVIRPVCDPGVEFDLVEFFGPEATPGRTIDFEVPLGPESFEAGAPWGEHMLGLIIRSSTEPLDPNASSLPDVELIAHITNQVPTAIRPEPVWPAPTAATEFTLPASLGVFTDDELNADLLSVRWLYGRWWAVVEMTDANGRPVIITTPERGCSEADTGLEPGLVMQALSSDSGERDVRVLGRATALAPLVCDEKFAAYQQADAPSATLVFEVPAASEYASQPTPRAFFGVVLRQAGVKKFIPFDG